MRYFNELTQDEGELLFARLPCDFSKKTPCDTLRCAVGGLLYMPSSGEQIAQTIISRKIRGLTSAAICLEDAVGDDDRAACEQNVMRQVGDLEAALNSGALPADSCPLLFVRVKDNDMLERMADFFVRYSRVVTGVILPKVTCENLTRSLSLVSDIHSRAAEPFYAMPILESDELMHCSNRIELLQTMRDITDRFFPRVLNIRMGATDLCGLYGIRRDVRTPIYSVAVVAGCIADIVRVFGINDRYTISGPVWEYFSDVAQTGTSSAEIAGLLQETRLDLANGILGKTCVHPAQLYPVQTGQVVTCETFSDAQRILFVDIAHNGVLPSEAHNKMNELKPHSLWAHKILRRAEIYGVYQENTDCASLLRALYGGKP